MTIETKYSIGDSVIQSDEFGHISELTVVGLLVEIGDNGINTKYKVLQKAEEPVMPLQKVPNILTVEERDLFPDIESVIKVFNTRRLRDLKVLEDLYHTRSGKINGAYEAIINTVNKHLSSTKDGNDSL